MCGFIGFISDIDNKENSFFLEKFNFYLNELNNRGPDYTEIKKLTFKNKIICVGFKRLAIQDLNTNSNKIFSSNEKILLFNGEIYNKDQLKKKYLEKIFFETNSDTEVLFNLLDKYGSDLVSEIQGIFSIVFINLKKETIECLRDFTGTKPLYYKSNEKNFFFSSEAWFLYSLSKKEINQESLSFYFNYGFSPEEETLIKSVKKVLPRNKLTINLKDFKLNKEIFFKIDKKKISEVPDTNEINSSLENSINLNLLADTKIGTFLSGGIDSSIVTSLAHRFNPAVESFTTVYLPENKYKKFNIDFYYANEFSKKLKIKLNVNYIENTDSVINDFYKVTNYLDEPISNLNFLNTYWQSKFAKETGTKVILTGDGSDELFCGYDRYHKVFTSEKLKYLNFLNKKIKSYNLLKVDELPFFFYSIFKNSNLKSLLNKEFCGEDIKKKSYFNSVSFDSNVDYINYFDFRYWLTNESNYKLDKCTMINSIEARIPFQDISLIKKFFFIKNKKKFKFFDRKYLLKKNDFIPDLIKKRKKTGWFTPDQMFLQNNFSRIISDVFSEEKIRKQKIFNEVELYKFFNSFKFLGYKIKRELITIILFQIWYDKVLKS